MGCLYACTCSGFCPGCRIYEPEQYFGHAEDLLALTKGYQDCDDMIDRQREYEINLNDQVNQAHREEEERQESQMIDN